jgi:hypothetical protein
MQQATVNLLADMTVQPGSLQTGLVAATASTDVATPSSTIASPAAGSNVPVGSPLTISGTATDAGGGVVGGVEVSLDGGTTWHPATGRATWTYTWTPTTAGSATIKSRAADDSGNLETPSAGVTITVGSSDTTPPTVTITAPASGATVSGTAVTVSANASDNVGVTSVQFLLDGASLGAADTAAPYSITWNTTTVANGAHTLSARASDAAGNTTTATNVSVTVSNADTTPPAQPTGLSATPSASQIALDWADNTESDLAGYNVYRAASAGGPFTKLNSALLTVSAYNDTTAPVGVTSFYRITAVDTSSNESSPAAASALRPDTTVPAAPSGLTATASDSGNSLDWADNAESDLAGYNVYRAASAGGPFTKLNAVALTRSDYDDTLAPTGTSFYQVTAVDASGNESTPSAMASAALTKTNRMQNPGFELDANNDGRPDSWTSSPRFTRSNTVARSGTFSGRNTASNNASYTLSQSITGLTAGTTYTFTGWTNIPSTSDTFTFSLQVRWRNASNGIIRTDTVASFNAQTSGWTKTSASLNAPAGTTNAQALIVVSSLNATIYSDDFAFR